jgi:aspartate/methionine/tyrosine aminotransferase
MRLADRMNRLGTETAFEVLVRAKALEATGVDVIHLEIGEPDFDTPANVVEAGCDALRGGWTHYGPAPGQPDLRDAIAEYINRRGTAYTPDQVVVTPGGKPVMFFVLLALLQEGDEAIYPDPGFPIYKSMIDFSGATAVPLPLREEHGFRLDVEELARLITPRTRLLIVNSPATRPAAFSSDPTSRRSPALPSSTTWSSSPTRSTPRSSTRASTTPSPPSPACRSGRSSSTASRRPTR